MSLPTMKFALALLPLFLAAQPPAGAPSRTQAVRSGSEIILRLSSGEFEVSPGAADQVLVSWLDGSAKQARVELSQEGSGALLDIGHTGRRFKAWIQVPAVCDLHVRVGAGDVTIGPVQGHKDIRLKAGSLVIKVPNPNDYAFVEASVLAGDLSASPFQVEKGGLFRSFEWKGPGRFQLHTRLLAGDLQLER